VQGGSPVIAFLLTRGRKSPTRRRLAQGRKKHLNYPQRFMTAGRKVDDRPKRNVS